MSPEAKKNALDAVLNLDHPNLMDRNREFHQMLTDGVRVEYQDRDGSIRSHWVNIVDLERSENNHYLAVNQMTFTEGREECRPDITLFINGLPLVVIELKRQQVDVTDAYTQLRRYRQSLPTLFSYNELLIASNGTDAKVGTFDSSYEWFTSWRTMPGEEIYNNGDPDGLRIVVDLVCHPHHILSLIRNFIIFEDFGVRCLKKLAGYHQSHAAKSALLSTLRATGRIDGEMDNRIGVVWHTQGSGKSLTMVCLAGMIAREPLMNNPTIVVITDRIDLDSQLYGTFSRCQDLLNQSPVRADSRDDLRTLLHQRKAGGIIFTTIHKFDLREYGNDNTVLSERDNIVVIADEAHRSHYDHIDGYASYLRDALPNASFIGFTGTPIEREDANTRAVFGDYISIYDMKRSQEDGNTVPIYYENHIATLGLDEDARPHIDLDFDEVTETEEIDSKEHLKTKWSQQEKLVGASNRIKQVVKDFIHHHSEQTLIGKVMYVAMSRRICIDFYDELIRQDPSMAKRAKVIMTGGSKDPPEWKQHTRTPKQREELAKDFRDPDDPFDIVIVRDMWLTGFDAPSLHTLYLDKPMKGHGLMQAIARVNRVYKDKSYGKIVDYLGIRPQLQEAVDNYTDNGGTGDAVEHQEKAVEFMMEKYNVCCAIIHGFDFSDYARSNLNQQGILINAAHEFIAEQDRMDDDENSLGKRFTRESRALDKAFSLAVPHEMTREIRPHVAFFQGVRQALNPKSRGNTHSDEYDSAIRQIVSDVVVSDGVEDILAMLGESDTRISIVSDEFLYRIQNTPHPNRAADALARLIRDDIKDHQRLNLTKSRSFADMLQNAIERYKDGAIDAALFLEELVNISRNIESERGRGDDLGLSQEEIAFYDALIVNQSAKDIMKDEDLKFIAQQVWRIVQAEARTDWKWRNDIQAEMRVAVRKVLRYYGYPPDRRKDAIKLIIEQAEHLALAK